MAPRSVWFVLIASIATAAFLRLGFWQLERLGERRSANASMVARRVLPNATLMELAAGRTEARFRAVSVVGAYDYAQEFLWTARTREGAPGVMLLTPLVPEGGGPAVLVNRGWVYAADGMRVNSALWREDAPDSVAGYAEVFSEREGPVFLASVERGVRLLVFDSLQARLPYAILPVLVVQQRGAGLQLEVRHPFRAALPPLDEGSHRGYALQWFAFALITAAGTGVVVYLERKGKQRSG